MSQKKKGGFTLIELLVVVMIIGILARVGVPQYFKVVEKDKAQEAVNFFLTLKGAQDRYNAKYGVYCTGSLANITAGTACGGFEIAPPVMHYFNAGATINAGGAGGWTLGLTRSNAPALYGAYVMTYDYEPNAAPSLTCNQANCVSDLLPRP